MQSICYVLPIIFFPPPLNVICVSTFRTMLRLHTLHLLINAHSSQIHQLRQLHEQHPTLEVSGKRWRRWGRWRHYYPYRISLTTISTCYRRDSRAPFPADSQPSSHKDRWRTTVPSPGKTLQLMTSRPNHPHDYNTVTLLFACGLATSFHF